MKTRRKLAPNRLRVVRLPDALKAEVAESVVALVNARRKLSDDEFAELNMTTVRKLLQRAPAGSEMELIARVVGLTTHVAAWSVEQWDRAAVVGEPGTVYLGELADSVVKGGY